MRTIEEWYNILVELTENTDFEVLMKTQISSPVVAIVPRGYYTPQRIAIYPKKTQNAGLVFDRDVFEIPHINALMGEPHRDKGNRPHYNNIPDETIIEVCETFLHT